MSIADNSAGSVIYTGLDTRRAKILYAILKLQEQPLTGATQKEISRVTGIKDLPTLSRILSNFQEAGYIKSYESHLEQARKAYEVEPQNNITLRDTAVLLLQLLTYPKRDADGKVDIDEFFNYLASEHKLKYFTKQDFVANAGRFADLKTSGHLELILHYVKPRTRTQLEQKYLELVANEVPLGELKGYKFDLKTSARIEKKFR